MLAKRICGKWDSLVRSRGQLQDCPHGPFLIAREMRPTTLSAELAPWCLVDHSFVAPTYEVTFHGSAAFREESRGMSCKVFPYSETCKLESLGEDRW